MQVAQSFDVSHDRRTAQLRRFILLDAGITTTAAMVCIVLRFTFVTTNWMSFLSVSVAAAALTMSTALVPLRDGRLGRALVILAGANWGIALLCALMAPFSWPIQMLAALLPAVVAVPYTTNFQFRVVVTMSLLVTIGVAALGLLQDFAGLTETTPGWINSGVVLLFTPAMGVLFAAAGLSSSRELQTTLRETVQANADLTRSRARVVEATDREQRRIERDLHDGAQQRLVGITLQLSAARGALRHDPDEVERLLGDIRSQVRLAQGELRDLVRGVYPPVLTEHGLAAALRAHVDQQQTPIRVAFEPGSTRVRASTSAEAAAYFCALEALQNATKHAGPHADIEIALDYDDEHVVFAVRDSGRGFADSDTHHGNGLTNMADRLGAAGGALHIRSAVGVGTTVSGRIPRLAGSARPQR